MDNIKAAFLAAFKGRTDVVPKLFSVKDDSGAVVRSGYAPICANFWTDSCPKKAGQKQACDKCATKQYVPMSEDLLQGHFEGKHVLGIYPLLPEGTCWFVAADFDDHSGDRNPLVDVQAYAAAVRGAGFTPYALRSKSGKGFHVYLFFEQAVPAWKARRVAFACLQDAKLVGSDVKVNSFDRLFPNQDELGPSKPLGNLISLPFQGEASKLGHTQFLDPETGYQEVFADQLAVLGSIRRETEAALDAIIAARGLARDEPVAPSTPVTSPALPSPVPTLIPQSQRNETLFRLACSLQVKGLSDDAILQALQAENAAKCAPPLSMAEVATIVTNVIAKYPKGGRVGLSFSSGQTLATPAAGMISINSQGQNLSSPSLVQALLPGAPVMPSVAAPGNLLLSYHKGIEGIRDDGKGNQGVVQLFPVPVVIAARLKCIDTGMEQVKVAWFVDGVWFQHIVDRRVIADTRDIVSLSNYGLPITSDTKEFMVKYLAAYDQFNRAHIPVVSVSSRLGWQKGMSCFLWGRQPIVEDDLQASSPIPSPACGMPPGVRAIEFKGSDEGDEQFADGFACSGSLTDWIVVANKAIAFPVPFVVLLASCAPPVLEIVGASNFIIETAGTTSTGKTTTQRLAASVWGNPDERALASCLHGWDVSRVWVERVGGVLNGLPLILDDTKRLYSSMARDQARSLVNSVIYAYASGKGRGRGSVKGTQRTGAFHSVLISSGEEPCADSSSEHGGARARVLSLWGSPFGTGQGPLVKDVNLSVFENHGFVGPMLVRHLLNNRRLWPTWKLEFRQLLKEYANMATGNNVADRLSEIFAVLEFTALRLQEAVPGLQPVRTARDVLLDVWKSTVTSAAMAADRALAALKDAWDWTASNQQKFFGRHKQDRNGDAMEPHGGWFGRWDSDPGWKFVAYTGKSLREKLEGAGYEFSATIKTWADRGWLLLDSKQRHQRVVRIDGAPVNCYCVRRDVLESELGLDFNDPTSSPAPFLSSPF